MAEERFTFFADSSSPFSQWYLDAPFTKFGITFPSAENFMMWRKGQVFGAPQAMLDELASASPRDARALGRRVPGFSNKVWLAVARPLVAEGNYAKFTQHPALLEALFATAGTTLVEAAHWDSIWGIGLSADDARALSRSTWLGTNWLGEVLTDVRDTLLRAQLNQG